MVVIAEELSKTFGVESLAVAVDVTDGASIAAMTEKIKQRFDRIDVLCNNAGASFGGAEYGFKL